MTSVVAARSRIGALLLVAVIVQTTLAPDLRVLNVAPDLMLVVVVCAGLTGGPQAGAWVGFWAGLLTDMFLTSTPVGLSALTYCIIGTGIGSLRASVLQERKALVPLAAFVGTAAGVLLFVAAGDVLGQHQLIGAGRAWLISVIVIESAWNAALSLPLSYAYGWAARGSAGANRLGAPVGSGAGGGR